MLLRENEKYRDSSRFNLKMFLHKKLVVKSVEKLLLWERRDVIDDYKPVEVVFHAYI